jgi:hypothetical protein
MEICARSIVGDNKGYTWMTEEEDEKFRSVGYRKQETGGKRKCMEH